MNHFEVRHVDDTEEGRCLALDWMNSDTKSQFPWVIWGPRAGFVLGGVYAVFCDRKDAEEYVKFLNYNLG